MPLVAAGVLLASCASGNPETAEQLYDRAGGADWCGGELRMTVEPWVGSCGDDEGSDRVAIGIAIDPGELRDSLKLASGDQIILVPEDANGLPAFQLRSPDRARLEAAREVLGGVILDGRDEVDAYLGPDPSEPPAPSEPSEG